MDDCEKRDIANECRPPDEGEVDSTTANICQHGHTEIVQLFDIDFERPTLETVNIEELLPLMQAFTEETFVPIPARPEFTVEDDFQDNMRRAERLLKQDKYYLVRHYGELVGFGGLNYYGHMPDNSKGRVYELTQVYTAPKYRRNKIFTRLVRQMMDDFAKEEPSSVIMSASEKKPVLDLLYAEGFKDIKADTMQSICETNPEFSPEELADEKVWIDSKRGHPKFRFVMQG